MRKLTLIFMLIMACFSVTGCASSMMQYVDPAQVNETLNSDEAAIVFFRPLQFVGAARTPGLVEADENGELSFVAIIPNGAKYFHRTTPGRHSYFWKFAWVLIAPPSHMLEANLEAGKIYYVGVFNDFNAFTPVTDTYDELFRKNLASCSWVENTPAGQTWFNNNITDLQNYYAILRMIQANETPKARLWQPAEFGSEVQEVKYEEIDMVIKPEYGSDTPVR